MEGGQRGILSAVVRFSLRFRGVIIALAVMLIFYGFYTLSRAKYDVFPEFTPPQVTIRAAAPGFSPEQVEVLVTRPVENAIVSVEGIESLRSSSLHGLSAITVRFKADSNIYRARQMVAEGLGRLSGQLPEGVTPFMTPLTSSTSTVTQLGLVSGTRSLMDLRSVADWTVKPRLLAASGVAQVQIYGGEVKQLQIQVLPERLIKYNLSIEDVLAAARKATGIRGAGFIEGRNQRIELSTEGQSLTPAELSKTVLVHHEDAGVTLGDVADVTVAPRPLIGAGAINGRPAVVLLVTAQYGTNTLEVTRNLDKAVADLRPALHKEGIEMYPDLFRPADFIHTSIHNMTTSLEIGAVLVVIVLFLFLFNLRTAAISCTAIPLSLLAAITVLERLGFSLNTMTMGGLAIAIGEVVDDAVIDVENILRRLRENRRLENPRPVLQVVLDASIEVRSAVVYATFAVVLVFVPVLTMSGLAGRIFSPLGIAYILAILASLLVALTVTPALCLALLGRRDLTEKGPPAIEWLKRQYRTLLVRVEHHPRIVAGGVVIFLLAGLAGLPFLRGEFLPEFREGDFIVHVTMLPGTSLEESLRIGRQVTVELLKLPYVRIVSQKTGKAEEGASTRGINASEIDVNLKPVKGGQAVFSPAEIRKLLAGFPGVNYSINTFLTERIEESVSGYTASVAVNIFSDDLDILDRKGREIAYVLRNIPGAADIQVQSMPGTPQVAISLRKEALMRWGINAVNVLDAIRTAYQGAVTGQVYDGDRVFDISVVINPRDRRDITGIGKLRLRSPGGVYISLQELADIYETSGRYVILHNDARRIQTVTCNVTGRSIGAFVADAEKQVGAAVSFPAGTYFEFTGTAEARARSARDLLIHSLLAGTGIILLLSIVLGNYRNVLLVLLNLPFALTGGLLIALATGGRLSLGSMVGFVTIFGITLRNSIMLLSHYEHLVSVEGMDWGPEAALLGASERLAPILMTALVTAFGLLPLAIGSGTAGREIQGPMAQVILGGLLTSTALNLLVLPALALRYGRFEKKPASE
ncbi:MAG: efflux RND transporter permease subunit [Nitrospiraceae bacterium]|nr:efflux RND transporter permease subunit [Nitrospiraceae bacterium]